MAKIGKRLTAAQAAFEGKGNLAVADAVALVKANASAKFDRGAMERTLAGLGQRRFLLNNVHDDRCATHKAFPCNCAMAAFRGEEVR